MADNNNKRETVKKPSTPAAKHPAQAQRPAPAAKPAAAKPASAARTAAPTARTAKPVSPAEHVTRTAQARTTVTPSQTAKPASAAKTTAAAKPAAPTARTAKQDVSVQSAKTAQSEKKTASASEKPSAGKPTAERAAKAPTEKKQTKSAASRKVAASKTPERGKSGGGFGAFVAAIKNNKTKSIIIAAISFVLILALVLGLVFGLRSCGSGRDNNPVGIMDRYDVDAYTTNTTVGFYGEVVGNTPRKKPIAETKNECDIFGVVEYPQYGKNLNSVIGGDASKVEARNALIREAKYLTTSNTWNGGGDYKWMDKDGYLYNGTTQEPIPVTYSNGDQRQLYKHAASVGLYGGDVSDTEPGIVKVVKMRPRGYTGYGVTGVYAPAGEVIKIEMSEADMNATGGIEIHIGQALYNGKANNIWAAKNQMQRFPILLNTLIVNKTTSVYDEATKTYTAYVGSFLGGPLYIRNKGVTFTATISGGVAYSHFILGYTTQKEFEENAKSTAPYFDLEVWNYGVLHSGPVSQAKNFSYDDLYKAAVLWDKVSSVTTTGSSQGIVFLYDPFVAAGAAVAFPGQMSVNCPVGWMASSLNYNQMVNSGSWGNYHEYHHNFQGYGVGAGGEVTNNGMTLVSYALFTKISAKRGISNFGAQGLGGWNDYTSAPWALEQTLKIARDGESPSNGNKGLALYATLLHNFGPDAYIKAKVRQRSMGYGESYTGYMKAWQDVTHMNMSYYFNDILKGGVADNVAAINAPMFVPVSSVYQTGRSYMYDDEKRYITTMQPYVIPYGDPFTIDLRPYTAPAGQYSYGSVVIPSGFTYKVKNIAQPEIGRISKAETDGVYTYFPDTSSKNLRSGKIVVTLEITNTSGNFKVDDVDLVLEFEQSHETNKMTLSRTIYSYDERKYDDAEAAYKAGFAGYADKQEIAHTNPVQNCNTDIWFYPDTTENREKYPNVPDHYFIKDNTISVIDGKLYAEEAGTYRVYLRGRLNCALFYSLDGVTYNKEVFATIKDKTAIKDSAYFRPNDPNSYFDVEMKETSWLYIKEVLISDTVGTTSYIGVGMKQWTKPMFTMVDKYYDKNGHEVSSPDDENYYETKTHYYNYLGIEVDESVANNATPIAPTIDKGHQPYVNAYRTTYEDVHAEFETDYFYTRKYTYSYKDNLWQNKEQTIVSSKYNRAPDSWGWGKFPEENLVDGNKNTWIHTSGNVSESSPLQFVVDMGEVRPVNRMIIYSQNRGDLQLAKSFTLMGSIDGNEFFEVGSWENAPNSGSTVTVNFEEKSFRYYIITVTKSSGGFIIISEIEMWRAFEVNGGTLYTPDHDMFSFGKGWYGAKADSTFGHIYVGTKKATMSFKFTGTRIGVLSSKNYGKNFEVYIDGKKVESIGLKNDDSATATAYLCGKLSSGEHRVEIKCTGEANIDSIVIYDEKD